MAKRKNSAYYKPLPKAAESIEIHLIGTYGIDKAEIIAKLALEKIRASRKRLVAKYGKIDFDSSR